MYKLEYDLCVVDEIKIQPFKAYFQSGWPIYSAKFVRFRMGSSKLPLAPENYVSDENEGRLVADDNYIWTYSSPEFPMLQENILQSFKLPCPVLCIGGVLKIELLGRVQKQVIDDLYYICVPHVEVLGRALSPKLAVDSSEASDTSVPKYFPDAEVASTVDEAAGPSSWTENILNALLRPLQLTEKVEESTEQKPLSDSS
ncbi:F-box protein [Ananas comosus]|uniref:F-box protein n=1 Tax=Ananas comosus TaxID=4615 RepID=A0A199V6B3_ANACO|nr:F-box protein [Ananas comosus]